MSVEEKPALDLFGVPRARLRRPGLAGMGLYLLGLSGMLQIVAAVLSGAEVDVGSVAWRVVSWFGLGVVCGSAALTVGGVICLAAADVIADGGQEFARWPRWGLLVLACLWAGLQAGAELAMVPIYLHFNVWEFFRFYRGFYLPMLVGALAVACGAYAVGMIYALQIGHLLGDRFFRMGAVFILARALALVAGQGFYLANVLAGSYGHGLRVPAVPMFATLWMVAQAVLAVALTGFFFLLGWRLRRTAGT